MPNYTLHISDGKEAEIDIDCDNNHVAINEALNALSKFACSRFPPPANVSIAIADAEHAPVATVSLEFKIDLAPGVML